MGHGIAQVSATAGYNVVLRDIKQEFLDKAMEKIKWSLDKLVSKEKISKGEIIEECHCLYMTDDEASYTHHLKPIKRNTIRVEDDGKLPYVIPFGYGSLFNSSIDP